MTKTMGVLDWCRKDKFCAKRSCCHQNKRELIKQYYIYTYYNHPEVDILFIIYKHIIYSEYRLYTHMFTISNDHHCNITISN